jgi:hypothetical protein
VLVLRVLPAVFPGLLGLLGFQPGIELALLELARPKRRDVDPEDALQAVKEHLVNLRLPRITVRRPLFVVELGDAELYAALAAGGDADVAKKRSRSSPPRTALFTSSIKSSVIDGSTSANAFQPISSGPGATVHCLETRS